MESGIKVCNRKLFNPVKPRVRLMERSNQPTVQVMLHVVLDTKNVMIHCVCVNVTFITIVDVIVNLQANHKVSF